MVALPDKSARCVRRGGGWRRGTVEIPRPTGAPVLDPTWERVGVRLPCATRHIVTDTCGLLVGAEVHPADVQDRDGAVLVIEAVHQLFPWRRHLFADSVYNGPNLR